MAERVARPIAVRIRRIWITGSACVALATQITLPSAGGSLKRRAQLASFVGIHHLRVGDHAAEPRSEIWPPVPVLRFDPLVLRAMENGAQTFDQMTREVRAT